MFRERVFADATSGYKDADFVIFGVPFDATSSFRYGSREAPDAMRRASYNFETYNDSLDVDLTDLRIHDLGDIDLDVRTGEMLHRVCDVTAMILRDNKIPIALGGEHTLTYGCARAFTGTFDGPGSDYGMIILDAHLDLRDEYLGVEQSHACVSRNIIDDLTDKCVLIGVRSGSAEEYAYARTEGILWHSADEVNDAGMGSVVREALDALFDRGCEQIYLSIDADVIDPAYAPGVGNPEPFGLSPRDVRAAIRLAAPYTCGLDIVEVNPGYDHGESAMLGARLVREFIAAKSVCLLG
ncbi:MAG TPA: agmatinase [Methanosarcinales archaeon]|nr:agmatinase [Methanosarcinales archaeon]